MRATALVLTILIPSGAALSAPTTYSSRDAFEAALTTIGATEATQTFSSVSGSAGTSIGARSGARFVATVGSLTLDSSRQLNVVGDLVTGNTYLDTPFAVSATGTIAFTVASPSIAFGIDLLGVPGPVTLNALGVNYLITGAGFFGVIDPAALTTTATFSTAQASSTPLDFDNVSTATARASAVPEPVSAALLGAGLLALGLRRRAG